MCLQVSSQDSVSKMEAIGKAGHSMSLAALKQHDPYINSIVDVTGQVALYTFNSKANEWEKTDIEGTLFVYTRSASPHYGFTIMNRLNMHNLVEPINKDLEFQLQEPFLLYRNSSLSIFSIWFYDKSDCHRIAELIAKVIDLEAQKTQQGSNGRNTPSKANGCSEDRPIDILEMLSKAKDEYERNQIGDSSVTSSSAVQRNAVPVTPATAETTDQLISEAQQQDKHIHSGPKHLTIEELFGASLHKERSPVVYPKQEITETFQQDCLIRGQNQVLPFPYEQSSTAQQPKGRPDSPSNKPSTNLGQHESLAQILLPQTSVVQPDVKNTPNYNVCLSPIISSVSPCEPQPAPILPSLSASSSSMIQPVQQATKRMSPLMSQPAPESNRSSQTVMGGSSPFLTPLAVTSTGINSGTGLPNQELLQKLKLTQQRDQLQQQHPLSKHSIAPTFPSTVNHLVTPESFKESYTKPVTLNSIPAALTKTVQLNKEAEVFPKAKSLSKTLPVIPSPVVPTTSSVASSVLLSPSVFQQSTIKNTEPESKASTISPLSLGAAETPSTLPSVVFNKLQLQEILLHLIENDPDFLSTIHEAYLQVLTKNVRSIQL